MQNRRSLESGSQSELEDVCRGKVATRCFIEAGWGIYARADRLNFFSELLTVVTMPQVLEKS